MFPIKKLFQHLVDFTSAFIIHQNLTQKLHTLGLNPQCNWILDVLTGHSQSVSITPSNISLRTGSIQGCVLSPLLFTILTYVCRVIVPSCLLTTVVWGHITGRIIEEGGTSEALIQREQPLKQVEKDPGDDCGFQVKHAHLWKLRGNGLELQLPGRTPQ